MSRLTTPVLVVLTAAALVAVAADPPAKKEDPAEKVRKQFYRCWLEVEEVTAGVRTTDAGKLNGNEYAPDKRWSWGRRGELAAGPGSPGVRIDPTSDPMRAEFVDEGRSRNFGGDKGDQLVTILRPCVFKFEDGNLVVAHSGAWVVEKEFKKGEDYPERPTGFKSTKENKLTVTTMKPCGKWDQD
jgi:hypothetical protein